MFSTLSKLTLLYFAHNRIENYINRLTFLELKFMVCLAEEYLYYQYMNCKHSQNQTEYSSLPLIRHSMVWNT